MGCDIHILVEREVGDKWVMVNRVAGRGLDRNYTRFAALAGVRGDGPAPKGLPVDLSDSGRLFAEDWGPDGHSHSFLGAEEAMMIFLATDYEAGVREKQFPCEYFFDSYLLDDNHRIVFWFDN